MAKSGTLRIGISGWTYPPWRGLYYPKGLPQKSELAYAAKHFRSVEINGTFYGLQKPESFARWSAETPDGFVFAIKGSRYITHMKRLKAIETPLANFLASGLLRLGPKLGPILWQFPPQMKFDRDRFEAFLSLLPQDTVEAAELAKKHDEWMKGRTWLEPEGKHPLRHAVEIRHPSFCCGEFIKLLRRFKIALVVADTPHWPLLMDLTSDFVYCRLHGAEELYASGYEDEALDLWARRIGAWGDGREPDDAIRVLEPLPPRASGRDVYVYFDNDAKVHAPFNAEALATLLRSEPPWAKKMKAAARSFPTL